MGSNTFLQGLLQKEATAVWTQGSSPVPLSPSRSLLPTPEPPPRMRLEVLGKPGGDWAAGRTSYALCSPTKAGVGGGVAVPGGSGWQLSPPVSGGREGRLSQFQKSEGDGPVPGPVAACQDERLLWGLGLRDLDGPYPTTAIDL